VVDKLPRPSQLPTTPAANIRTASAYAWQHCTASHCPSSLDPSKVAVLCTACAHPPHGAPTAPCLLTAVLARQRVMAAGAACCLLPSPMPADMLACCMACVQACLVVPIAAMHPHWQCLCSPHRHQLSLRSTPPSKPSYPVFSILHCFHARCGNAPVRTPCPPTCAGLKRVSVHSTSCLSAAQTCS
jgi:hypothetical protein